MEDAASPRKPDWVKIFSLRGQQQVQQVRFPVGATFADFKVEVHYPDGYTRFVTKKAVLQTKPPSSPVVTGEHGKLFGLRPGSTEVTAEFQGMTSTDALKVDVSAEVEIDKIAIEPGNVPLRPGETYELRAVGYKDGRSVGDITGLGTLTWKSSQPDVARLSGSSVIAANLGQSSITVERNGLTSLPAQVTVSNTVDGDLRVEPKTIEMYEGERQQLGDAIRVLRGDLDVSQQAIAVPESPGVVRFDPATRTLTALQAGTVPLGITMGDKVTRVQVTVRPRAIEAGGSLIVEPGALILAPGQADRLNVFVETPNGDKIDRTGSAIFKVTDGSVADVDSPIARVRARKPGKTDIKVYVPGFEKNVVTVPLEVKDEGISELTADPAALEMAAGDHQHLRVFGRAATSGLKEMFPQPDLKVAPQKGEAVAVLGGEDVQAKAVGDDTIDVSWRDKLKIAVPVKVAANAITDLEIAPDPQTINVGQAVTYAVSAMHGGNRVILTTENGLRMNVTDPTVANVATGTTVRSIGPGQTKVVAEYGEKKAEAILNVTPGMAGVPAVSGVGVISDGIVYDDYGHRIVIGDGSVVGEIKPAGKVVALVFRPDVYMAGVQALPQTTKVLRQYENGGFDDVSNKAQITQSPNPAIAKIAHVEEGWKVSPVGPGLTTVTASLEDPNANVAADADGKKVLRAKMAIEINGGGTAGAPVAGQLIVEPKTLLLWSGETQAIGNAVIDPGGGQSPVPVEVNVKAPDGQGIVSVEGNNVTGRSVGDVPLKVSTAGGQSTTVNVHVTAADSVHFNPPELDLQAGQSRAVAVMARSADGTEVAVQAPIESLDKNVLDADPAQSGQFIARSQGQTQLHAAYRGKEVFAKVSVSGKRFEVVNPALNERNNDQFDVTIEVLAAAAEGELEYRVYSAEDASPKENWVPNQADGENRKVILRSEAMNYGPRGQIYHLVLEARDKATKRIEKYPLTLQLGVTLKKVENPQAPAKDSNPGRDTK